MRHDEADAAALGFRDYLRTHTLGRRMEAVGREFWPFMPQIETEALKVWVSRDYLAVLYRQRIDGRLRLTVNRTRRDGRGWRDGITWDELQRVKNETIGPKFWCAEAYPPEDRVVNVANMRHLWVLEEPGHIGAVAFPTESFWKKGL